MASAGDNAKMGSGGGRFGALGGLVGGFGGIGGSSGCPGVDGVPDLLVLTTIFSFLPLLNYFLSCSLSAEEACYFVKLLIKQKTH